MKHIILTKKLSEGKWLKESILCLNKDLNSIQCFTKDNVIDSQVEFADVEVIFSTWYMPEFSEEEIAALFPSLKVVFYAAGTVKYFAEPFLRRGIQVFSAANANGIPVAEYVAAQVVLANKGYYLAQHSYKSFFGLLAFRRSRRFAEAHLGNCGSKVGLIGFGAVGRQVTRYLRPYKLKVAAYDPFVSDAVFQELGVMRMELNELFSECDVISNHLPDISTTKGMLNYELFSKMKDNVTFINTGRGAQLVEKDLSKAIRRRKNACAVLDVTRHEPVFPWSPLLWNRKVFITPHIAGSMSGEDIRLVEAMMTAYSCFLAGEESEYEVFLSQLSNRA